jgi:DNA-directed RNA polymerase specialized sigma24 family protein
MMAKPFGDPYERFPTTHWSLVARAGMDRAEARRDALGRLLTRYLPALRAHLIRHQGMSAADADDAVQQFVADKILQRDLIGQADAERGKFRTFLLTSLKRFVANRRRDEAAKKRAPDAGEVLPLGDRAGDVVSENRAADVFDVQWAREVLSLTLTRMQQECRESHRDDVWSVFHCRLVQPLLEGTQPPDYETIVERFGLKSPAQASNVLITAKRMFARALRATVGEYTQDPAEIEAEIDQLQNILAGR